ncbi:hypothetical protein Tco_0854778, partial [Tanacetum coccineum]
MLDGGKALADAQLFTPIFEWESDLARSFRERSGYVNSLFVEWPREHDEGSEPGNLDIPESSFFHPHALLASSILSVWLLLPHILFRTPLITAYRLDLRRTALAFSISARSVSSLK